MPEPVLYSTPGLVWDLAKFGKDFRKTVEDFQKIEMVFRKIN
jgi:hypothetical protein